MRLRAQGMSWWKIAQILDLRRIRGWEVTLRSPQLFRKGQLHLAYSQQHALGQGAVSGGLTDFSPPESRFLLDHAQLHTLSTGFEVNLPRRSWVAGNLNYGLGFPDGGTPVRLPGHTTADFSLGKALGESWSVS